jgi:hypothetical protein
MGLHGDLPVYKSTYDLLLSIFRFTRDFAKEYKYTVGERLKNDTIDLLQLIYRANTKSDRLAVIQDARERIEVIRLYIRLMKDLQQISLKQFVQISDSVEDVSKQLTGWQKSLSK